MPCALSRKTQPDSRAVFGGIHPALRKSITFDNDTAFAQHALLRTTRAMTTWICDGYASEQDSQVLGSPRFEMPTAPCDHQTWASRCAVAAPLCKFRGRHKMINEYY
jgi:hypothetical protein